MALDTLRAAVWSPSDVPLDRAGWWLPRWRNRLICIELYYRRRDRRFRPGMAVNCGSVVCAADSVETNKIMIMQKAGLQSHFLLEITALPICADIFYENVLSFYIRLRKDAGGKAFCFV